MSAVHLLAVVNVLSYVVMGAYFARVQADPYIGVASILWGVGNALIWFGGLRT